MLQNNIILIQVPGSDRKDQKIIPYGLLQIANIFKKDNYAVTIVDLEIEDEDLLYSKIKELKPSIVGYGGISSAYYRINTLTTNIRTILNNEVLIIAGGALSSMYKYLLTNNYIDFAFHGEAEVHLEKFLKYVKNDYLLEDIGGISFNTKLLNTKNMDKKYLFHDEIITRTFPEEQINDLDTCEFPDYSLIDLSKYVYDIKDNLSVVSSWFGNNHPIYLKHKNLVDNNTTKFIEIYSSRGCTHKCTFCYRHVKGIRRYSIEYFFDHLEEIQKYTRIDGVNIVDELFNNDIEWIDSFIDKFKKTNLKFLKVSGMRVDKINEELFLKLSKINCIEISFGHESGSSDVLKYYKKGTTREDNILAEKLCRQNNILSTIQLVLGSPAETLQSISETIEFVRETDARIVSSNWIIPLPETPIWKDVMDKNKINNIEEYIAKVYFIGPHYNIGNFSNLPNIIHSNIGRLLRREYLYNRIQAGIILTKKDKLKYILLSIISYTFKFYFYINKNIKD